MVETTAGNRLACLWSDVAHSCASGLAAWRHWRSLSPGLLGFLGGPSYHLPAQAGGGPHPWGEVWLRLSPVLAGAAARRCLDPLRLDPAMLALRACWDGSVTTCLQNPLSVSHTVHSLGLPVPQVCRNPPRSRLVGVSRGATLLGTRFVSVSAMAI